MIHQGKQLRHELKYAINDLEYHYLRSRLKTLIKSDPNVGATGEYNIRSLYFDNYLDTSFTEKEAGVYQRGKYRVRIYGLSDKTIKLEYKEKFDNLIAKTSRTISRSFYDQIFSRSLKMQQVKDDPFLLAFYLETRIHLLEPRIIVDYIREPYICDAGNVRITFDKQLKSSVRDLDVFNPDPMLVSPKFSGTMILEVKYDDFIPEYVRNVLNLARHQRMAISKYTICREVRSALDWRERSI